MTNKEAIYRLNALLTMCDFKDAYGDSVDHTVYDEAVNMAIEALKAQQWIPVSERLPNNDDFVIVTILDESGDTPYRCSDFGWYLDKADCWIIDAEQRTDVIAWMPLPEPYKEEKDG